MGRATLTIPDLPAALRRLLAQVPRGRVTTYGALAEGLGALPAARWVATCLLDPAGPCDWSRHRVVLKGGGLGSYFTGRVEDKQRLLAAEGVPTSPAGCVDLERFGFDDFRSRRPLVRLRELQSSLAGRLRLTPPGTEPEFVGGVDVSYVPGEPDGQDLGFATLALVHVATGELVWSHTVRRPVRFPYIPGFLAFRELPILLQLLCEVRDRDRLPEVILVDGNGVLHQRQAGIASHLGVAADVPTVGVGKSLLCGSVAQEGQGPEGGRQVVLQGRTVACAMQAAAGKRPIYVSPGHRTDLPFAARLVGRLLRGQRLPEPLRLAHALSRREAARVAGTGGAPVR